MLEINDDCRALLPTAARSLIHPALNLSASILVLLSFYLTWQICTRALCLASSNVHAHSTGATAVSATASARRSALASVVCADSTSATIASALASARQSVLVLDVHTHLTGGTAALALESERQSALASDVRAHSTGVTAVSASASAS